MTEFFSFECLLVAFFFFLPSSSYRNMLFSGQKYEKYQTSSSTLLVCFLFFYTTHIFCARPLIFNQNCLEAHHHRRENQRTQQNINTRAEDSLFFGVYDSSHLFRLVCSRTRQHFASTTTTGPQRENE